MPIGFWDFSLKLYEAPAVQAACLAVQDEHGADVNVALYLLWRAAAGDVFDLRAVRKVDAVVAPWRTAAVAPLRAVRRQLKAPPLLADAEAQERLRSQLKKVELAAEKLEQQALEAADLPATGAAAPLEAARLNLAAYAGMLETAFPYALVAVFAERLAVVAD